MGAQECILEKADIIIIIVISISQMRTLRLKEPGAP